MPDMTAAEVRRFLASGKRQISDTQQGLVMRRKAGAAAWYYREQVDGKDVLHLLGAHELELDLRTARRLASDLLFESHRGIPVDDIRIREKRIAIGLKDVLPAAPVSKFPTFGSARTSFLTEGILGRGRSKATWKDYRKALEDPLVKALEDVPIDTITRQTLARIVDEISRSGRQRSAVKLAAILQSMWGWLAHDANQHRFGVAPAMLLRFRPLDRPGTKIEKVIPSPSQIHALLNGAMDEESELMRAATTLLVLTGQRIQAVATARREHFALEVDPRTRRTYHVWRMPASSMKSKRTHSLPIPDRARWIVERVKNGSLFPGDAEDGHIAPGSLTHFFGSRFLALPYTPHSVRTALTTAVRNAAFARSDVKLILDHAEGRTGDVTLEHYDFYEDLDLKQRMLAAWIAAIDEAGKPSVRTAKAA